MADTNQSSTGARVDPYRAYNFKLQIQGVTQGHFTHCSAIAAKVVSIRYREGGDGRTVRQLAGPVDYEPVCLQYGLTASNELWEWFQTSVRGVPRRQNASIILLGPDAVQEVMRWDLEGAWPCEWRGAALDSMGREMAIESLTLVFEGITRTAV
jgi:phage tail-like protein